MLRNAGAGVAALASARYLHPLAAAAQPADAPPFDIFTGYAPSELVIPRVIPEVYKFIAPVASDATLVLRLTVIIANAWFDAIAPYHPTAVGVSSRIERQPASEATLVNKNIAILFASHRVLTSMLPRQVAAWDDMLHSVGLDPTARQHDMTNPVGIGNIAGDAVAEARAHDGMNQMGDEGGRTYNRRPYANCSGYAPVNTAYELSDPSRWQPEIVSSGNGLFSVQQCVSPQMGTTVAYSYDDPAAFMVPDPTLSDPDTPGYRQQADEVLAASAELTDYQKMVSELFDDKFLGLGFSALFMAQSRGLSLDELVQYDFMTIMASFDTAIAVWNAKLRYDAVRPASAVAWIYGDEPVTAWGGPGMGTVTDMPGREWRSYLQTADHPEYPSGSASFCAAHAEASRRYFGTDDFGWSVPRAAGSSRVEPGVTPEKDIVLGPWATWSDFEHECGLSRLWGGVHFASSVPAGQAMGHSIGALVHDFVMAHISGNA